MRRHGFATMTLVLTAGAACLDVAGWSGTFAGEHGVVHLQLPVDPDSGVTRLDPGPVRDPAAARPRHDRPKAETVLLAESFESAWPASPWRVTHPTDAPDVEWGRTDVRAADGRHSIWCARSGSDAPGNGRPVPANTASWTIAGPFDLSEATSATLTFELWLATEQFQDLFMWLASTDGQSFSGRASSTDTDGWRSVTADFTDWADLGDLTGSPHVWIAFVYQSDHRGLYEGAYVDDVRLVSDSGGLAEDGFTWSTSEDFELGELVGLDASGDQLQLGSGWSALPFVWVPSPNAGTISKIDSTTGNEVARYRTGPARELEPLAVAIDLDGSCWVGNRSAGSVVKIGLAEAGGCVDRNGNGTIDTSADADGDGDITAEEMLAWGADECALHEVVLVKDAEATYTPGENHDTYDANAIRALAVDADNNLWVGVAGYASVTKIDGASGAILDTIRLEESTTRSSGLVVDRDGILWSASWPDPWVLRFDPTSGEEVTIELGHGSYGVALDEEDHLFVTGFSDSAMSRLDISATEVDWTIGADWQAAGVTVTPDGDVWVAARQSGTLRRYSSSGFLETTTPMANLPTSVSVDGAGKLWVTGLGSNVIVRLDPASGLAELQKTVTGGSHETWSDLAGVVARSITTHYGTWTAVWDSTLSESVWGTVAWVAEAPEGTSLRARARSSEDQRVWSNWEEATNGEPLTSTPAGRYLQVQVAMQDRSDGNTPVLEELTVKPAIAAQPPSAGFVWSPSSPVAGEDVLFSDTSSGNPTSWSWEFGDGSSSTDRNPVHAFAAAGTYPVNLTVANDQGSSEATEEVVVAPSSTCSLTCSASAPESARVDELVRFAASATPDGCTGTVTYAWEFGDGATSTARQPSHTYTAPGTYSWAMGAVVDGVSCGRTGAIVVSDNGPVACIATRWVPVVSHAAGVGSSQWRSDVGLLAIEAGTTAAELRLHASDGVLSRTVELQPGGLVELADVVDWLSPGRETSAALEVCADGEVVVTARVYTALADDDPCLPGGTFGQFMDGLDPAAGLASGEHAVLSQLRENARFRTNIGLVNSGTETAVVAVELFDGGGSSLGGYTAELAPGQWAQASRPFAVHGGRDDLVAGWARVTVTSGEGVLAYASVVDNVSNDATTMPMRR